MSTYARCRNTSVQRTDHRASFYEQALYTNLGHLNRGDVVEVTLSSAANVRLLDGSNFSRYRRGLDHRYQGGLARQSPVRLAIPSSGSWHLVVDMQGLRGTTRS